MSAGPKDGDLDSFSVHFTLALTCPLQPLASENQESSRCVYIIYDNKDVQGCEYRQTYTCQTSRISN